MAKTMKKVNVATVGVGFLGSLVLAECAKAGLSALGLERGERPVSYTHLIHADLP